MASNKKTENFTAETHKFGANKMQYYVQLIATGKTLASRQSAFI